jgi:cyclic-di-AMP phosphodiesterase PgpH
MKSHPLFAFLFGLFAPSRLRKIVFGACFALAAIFLVAYTAFAPSATLALGVGQVARQDIIAPLSLSYESEVLTGLAQQAASDAVPRVYDPPNPAILREQVQVARNILDFIATIRADTLATPANQQADLAKIEALTLSADLHMAILALSDDDWQALDTQVMQVLERAMRSQIRAEDVRTVQNNLPNLVSISLTEGQSTLVVAIVSNLIRPNMLFNEERTNLAKEKAASEVKPVMRSFIQGQIVIREGSLVSEADHEALTQLGLLQPIDQRWRMLAGAGLAVLLSLLLFTVYVRQLHVDLYNDPARIAMIAFLFLITLGAARLFGSDDTFIAHLYPAAAFSLVVLAIAGVGVAAVATGALALLVGVSLSTSLEPAAFVLCGGMAGLLLIRHSERVNAYFAAGVAIGAMNIVVGVLFGLMQNNLDPSTLLPIIPAGLISGGLAAGLGLVGLYLSSSLLNLPTGIKLLELQQPNQALLQRLLREAPGTYQHSLQVANLAELAAERINANALLVRVGALYHDIGKLTAPAFFAENQAEGVNPHGQMSPQESARLIISHVTEGAKLARHHRLPQVIVDFILQHHGTTRTLYFYNQALAAVGCDESKVDEELFTYPGPTPQSREAAIMMLADASETIVRAKRSRDKSEIAEVVESLFRARFDCGQLDQSQLTLQDLRAIKEVFITSLQGVFHPRISYPATPTPRLTQEFTPKPGLFNDAETIPSVAPLPPAKA